MKVCTPGNPAPSALPRLRPPADPARAPLAHALAWGGVSEGGGRLNCSLLPLASPSDPLVFPVGAPGVCLPAFTPALQPVATSFMLPGTLSHAHVPPGTHVDVDTLLQ